MTDEMLIAMAKDARKNSYSPYSGFSVGAALLTSDGRVFCGCNIENSSFSPTCCAERTAIFKAISEGSFRDKNSFVSIAVVGGKTGEETKLCTPCGVCRQVLAEFCSADFLIITEDGENIRRDRLSELLPKAFVFERDSEI